MLFKIACTLFVLIFGVSVSKVTAQIIIGKTSVCVDEIVTYRVSTFGCGTQPQWMFRGSGVAESDSDSIRIQFVEKGNQTLIVKCNTSVDSISIMVGNCLPNNDCIGQNLVPNPSFEEFANCSVLSRNFSLTDLVKPWDDFPKFGGRTDGPSSTDYLNANCSSVSSFYNSISTNPRTGKGFIGGYQINFIINAFQDTLYNNREYAAVKLKTPLTLGRKYKVKFYTKRVGHPANTSSSDAIDQIGARFMTEQPYSQFAILRSKNTTSTYYGYIGGLPQVTSPKGEVIEDTTFWRRIEGSFIADKAYEYVMIGSFLKDNEIKVKKYETNKPGFIAYYLFDDVSVQEEGTGVDFTWIATDTLICKGDTARVSFRAIADTIVLDNKKTRIQTPLSSSVVLNNISPVLLPSIQDLTAFDILLKKNNCLDTVRFNVRIAPSFDILIKKTTCYPADTNTSVFRYKTFYGCDSIITVRTLLNKEDTTQLTVFTCDSRDTATIFRTLPSFQGCDSFVVTRHIFNPPDTTQIKLLSCNPKDTGLIVSSPYRNRFGCDSIVIKRTELAPSVHIELGEDLTLPEGLSFTFKPTFTGDAVESVIWQPSTGLSCTVCREPELILTHSMRYSATAIGRYGCRSRDDILVKTVEVPYVFVPSVFSPNDDGVNDVLTVLADEKRVKHIIRFAVFNRWGNLLFENHDFSPNDYQKGWDGLINGQPTLPDVFVYLVEFEKWNGKRAVVGGNTTIVR